MRIVYLAYEMRSREFVGYQEMAHHLVESDIADFVFVGDKFILQRLALSRLLIKGLYMLKSAQYRIRNKLKKLRRSGYLLFVQDAESVCVYEQDGFHDCYMKRPESLKYVETIFTSSSNEHETVKNLNPHTRVSRVGYMRFNHLLEKDFFTKIYERETNNLIKKYGDHILIITSNTSYKFSSHLGLKSADNEEKLSKFLKESGYEDEWIIQKQISCTNYSHLALFSLMEFIRIQISEGNNKYKLIFRPHPSEDNEFYKTLFKNLDLITIDDSCSLPASMLAASKIILSPSSTTSFESALLEKESFCLMPESKNFLKDHIKDHITTRLSTISKDPKDLYKKINFSGDLSKQLIKERKDKVKNLINLNSKSMKLFCEEIKRIVGNKKDLTLKDSIKIKIQKTILLASQNLYKLLISIDYIKNNTPYGNIFEKLKGKSLIDEKILATKFPNCKQEKIGNYIMVSRR